MRIKKFTVNSMPIALQTIREELGENAVILNSKEIKTGGFLGLFTKNRIEVIAAVQENPEPVSPKVTQQKTAQEVQPLRVEQHAPSGSQDQLIDEIAQLRKMMMQMVVGSREEKHVPQALAMWMDRLKKQGVAEHVLDFMMDKMIKQCDALMKMDSDAIKSALMVIIEEILQKRMTTDHLVKNSTKIINVVGPTGVGKTTTIAKLAAKQVLKQNRRVGMLTTDTFRIAAVEQLKTYAGILNIPCEVVFSPEHFSQALQNLEGCDLIFMDTAGRNYREAQFLEQIECYLKTSRQSENYLVLSLTAKYEDMKPILDAFIDKNIHKVVLTKLDETTSYGSILNIAFDYPYEISYFTNGQSVPEDILPAETTHVTKSILGEVMTDGPSATT